MKRRSANVVLRSAAILLLLFCLPAAAQEGTGWAPSWLFPTFLTAAVVFVAGHWAYLLKKKRVYDELSRARTALEEESEERRRDEAALADSERRWHQLIQSTPLAILVMQLDDDDQLEVIEANHAAERLLGLHGLAGGVCITAHVFSKLPEPVADRFAEIALTGEGWERRDVALNSSGFRPTICDIYAFQTAPREMAAVVLDASDRAEAQRALVVSERAAAVGTLVSGIAHRFNNINVGILGYADLLLSHPEMDEAHRKKLERIREAALQGRDITGQLLALAQGSSSERHPTSVNEVVADMVNMLRHTLEADNIVIDMQQDETPRLWLDRSELSQVILALLTNAQHAVMGQEKRHIAIEVCVEDAHVCVHISDTGCGIAPGDLDRIFMPFYTTKGEHAPSTSVQVRVKGAGLGLSVADAIVRQYSGSITVDSEPGHGSTFTLWLPLPANGREAR